jgi:hypothetical protein
MKRWSRTLLGVAFIVFAFACAAKTPVTTWYYSSWYSQSMTASLGGFEKAQAACLAEGGITDPAAVEPGSSAENAFIACLNARQWCTNAYHCNRSGV